MNKQLQFPGSRLIALPTVSMQTIASQEDLKNQKLEKV